jgi:hypothetical protein
MITRKEYQKAKRVIRRFEEQQLCNNCNFYYRETYISGYSPDHNNEMTEDHSTQCYCTKLKPRKEIYYFSQSYGSYMDMKKPKWCPKLK